MVNGRKILVCAAAVVLLAGCARDQIFITGQSTLLSPQPPPIFSTPAVYLLTNSSGVLAKVRIEDHLGKSHGRLFARGTKLFYAPEEKKLPRRYGPSGGFSYLWDAAEGKGYVLSEALQGYAPISHSSTGPTNILVRAAESGSGLRAVVLTAQMANGKSIDFEANGGVQDNGLPARVSGGNPPFSATFEKVRSEPPPAEVFVVPEGFTPYKSGEAMVDELAVRYRNLKRKIYD